MRVLVLGLSNFLKTWSLFLATNIGLAGYFLFALLSPASSVKTVLLPGVTTHGHYQIELDCNACHTAGMSVQQDACLNCHEQELKIARDTHPASKFSDPTNAKRLATLDATKCVTCHQEHVDHRTLEMGLTMPSDYCYHCHQETLETRPSHANLAFDSCANAGCHNYHDNRALYENFLMKHVDDADHADQPTTLVKSRLTQPGKKAVTIEQADGQRGMDDNQLLADWETTAHAFAGVNCSGCHVAESDDATVAVWSDAVSHDVCAKCHEGQAEGFLAGRHGMRLSLGLVAFSPSEARLPMHAGAGHEKLDCSACHGGHRFDTQFAAVDACLNCHNDSHSQQFKTTSHFALWEAELAGESVAGSGVTCATCHLPRVENDDGEVMVQHNQNNNLRPNEKMIREVCLNCHGLQFSLNSLADTNLIDRCFDSAPSAHIESIEMAVAWFEEKERQKQERKKRRNTRTTN